jgi:DnaK suppressor protein
MAKSSNPKKEGKGEGLPKQELEKFKAMLKEIRVRLVRGLAHLEEESLNKSQRDSTGDLSGYSLHMADVATDSFDTEFNIGLASNEQQYLNMIDAALRRIDEGTYGTCEECSKAIPTKRLMAMPHARLCIKCQEEEEKNARRS